MQSINCPQCRFAIPVTGTETEEQVQCPNCALRVNFDRSKFIEQDDRPADESQAESADDSVHETAESAADESEDESDLTPETQQTPAWALPTILLGVGLAVALGVLGMTG